MVLRKKSFRPQNWSAVPKRLTEIPGNNFTHGLGGKQLGISVEYISVQCFSGRNGGTARAATATDIDGYAMIPMIALDGEGK